MGFIDKPRQVWWRKLIFQVHLWVGILLLLYVLVISVSGSVLVFGPMIRDDSPRIPLHKTNATPLLWGEMVATAQRLHPDCRVKLISDESSHGRALRVFLTKVTKGKGPHNQLSRNVYFDPSSGQILRDQELNYKNDHPIFDFLEKLHVNLLSGNTGRQVNAICAAFLLVLCLTGIVIWWPGLKIWKQGISVNWKARWKRLNYDSHRALGFWTLLLVSGWAFSGVYFGYAPTIRNALATILPFATKASYPPTSWKPGQPLLSINDVYLRARQVLPKSHVSEIVLPPRAGSPIKVFAISNEWPTYLHSKTILLDPSTGALISANDAWKDGRLGDRLLLIMFMLHFGTFDSVTLKAIIALFGLSPALLAISGMIMWWNRVVSKRWIRAREPNQDQIPQPPRHPPSSTPAQLNGRSSPVPVQPDTLFDASLTKDLV